MFKFLKELRESIIEGYNEAKQELLEEEEQKAAQLKEAAPLETLSLENVAIAMSCPFRKVLISGSRTRLFRFGALEEKDTAEAAKLLKRDFDIEDADSLESALEKSALFPDLVFRNSVRLYQITTSVDLGCIAFDDYRERCASYINIIFRYGNINSWQEFADAFMKGDCVNNFLGKKRIASSVRTLLKEPNSPWSEIE